MDEISEKKEALGAVLTKQFHESCLKFMREERKLKPKTQLLYGKVLEGIFKNSILTQKIYSRYFNKGNYFKAVLRMMEKAAAYYDIPFYSYKSVRQRPHPRKNPQYWSEEEILNLIGSMQKINRLQALMMKMAYFCGAGLRFSSVLFIQWSDFNWKEWAQNPSKAGRINITVAKGGKQAVLPVDKRFMAELYEIARIDKAIAQQVPYNPEFFPGENYFFKDDELKEFEKLYDKETAQVFWTMKKWNQINYNLKKVSKSNLNRKFKFHSLRHSRAIVLLQKGMSLLDINKLLMHTNLETTRIYLNLTDQEVQDKFDRLT